MVIWRKLDWVLILVLVCAGVLYLTNYVLRSRKDWQAYKDAECKWATYNGMKEVALSVQYSPVRSSNLPTDVGGLLSLIAAEDDGAKSIDMLSRHVDAGIRNGTYKDAWGTPIQLKIISPRKYVFVSLGRNRKDDGGKDDDILYEFDPLEYMRELSLPDANTK